MKIISICFLFLQIFYTWSADIIVFGDSWGTYGHDQFEDQMAKHGLTVANYADAGSTIADWAQNPDSLKEIIDIHPEAKLVWLTLGGNDWLFAHMLYKELPEESMLGKMILDTKTILDPAFEAYPDIKVVQIGYELMNWDISPECEALKFQILTGYCDFDDVEGFTLCANEVMLKLQYNYTDVVTNLYPNHYSIDLFGTCQEDAGIEGASRGSPVLDVWQPSEYMDPTCIHLSAIGYETLFKALWSEIIEQEIVYNQLESQSGWYGSTISCSEGNVIVGTCGSGVYPDCDGSYHHEICSSEMNYPENHTETHNSYHGNWEYCSSGAIISQCRSGRDGDCGNSIWQKFTCNLDIPISQTECSYVNGKFGETIYCPDGNVAVGSCESGMYADCHGSDQWWNQETQAQNERYWTGLKCCPIGSEDNSEPVWIYPVN